MALPGWIRSLVRWQIAMLAATFFLPVLFVASVVPYRFWDSLAFGSWSRIIADTGRFSSASVIDLALNRPLFYVAQGLAWHVFGYHEWLGRWLSALFGGVLLGSLWLLAGRLTRDRDGRELARSLAVGVMLASSLFATYVAAGMTDVPVAATAAATAALLWSERFGQARPLLVAAAAAATVLSKPTGLIALGGVALATLVLSRGRRTLEGLVGLAGGVVVALAYDGAQAHRLHESLGVFLKAGNTDYYRAQANAARVDSVLRAEWLGEAPRLIVLFGILFAVARVAGARARLALAVAGPAAIVWSILGPVAADGGAPYPFDGSVAGLVGYLTLAAALLAAPFLARDEPFGRRAHAALLLWLAPGFVAWIAQRADAPRFLSPAWPALALLAAVGLTVVALVLARLRPAAALVPVAAVALLVVANVTSIDDFGRAGWRGLLDLGPSGWGSKAAMENYAYGPFSYELDLARANVRPGQQILSSDGRLTYFFPERVNVVYAHSCADLRDARLFALLTSGDSADIMTRIEHSSVDPLAWLQCRNPRLELVGAQEGIYAVYVVGGKPARPPTAADCRVSSYPGQLDDAVFADGVSYAKAREVRDAAAKVGFGPKIEQTGCSTFRVVITGLPTAPAKQADFRREAASTGFRIKIVPAVRYPEVPADVTAMR